MYLGIDLGTTNTVVARSFVDAKDNLITETVQIGQMDDDNWEKYPTLPSMIYFDDKDIIVGREAKRQRKQDSEHVVTNAKRFMGTIHKWEIDGIEYEAKDIAAMVLQHCKKTIEREGNMNYDSVVITVPASFNASQVQDTLLAAKMAGFKDEQVSIKHEPTAALLSFIDDQAKKQEHDRVVDFSDTKRLLVFDLGGGTCDTSIIDVKVENGEMNFTEIAIGRYQELGGIDFDDRLALGLMGKFFKDNNIYDEDISQRQKDIFYRKLKLAAESLKEKLSAAIYNKITQDPDADIDSVEARFNIPEFYEGKPLKIRINKKEYDEYTKSLYIDKNIRYRKFEDMDKDKNIIGVIRKTLEDYDIEKSSIDYIFMTGGMSKFPTVKEKLQSYLKCPVLMPENPMEAVARGASIYQYYKVKVTKHDGPVPKYEKSAEANCEVKTEIQQDTTGIVDIMMLAEAVMLDVNEGLPKVIIPKKTIVPYSGEIKGAFRTASPSGIKLDIMAGEDEFDSSMRMQKSLEKEFQFPVKSGTPFDIKYTIDQNKAIKMTIVVDDKIHGLQELELSVYSDMKIVEKDYNLAMEV